MVPVLSRGTSLYSPLLLQEGMWYRCIRQLVVKQPLSRSVYINLRQLETYVTHFTAALYGHYSDVTWEAQRLSNSLFKRSFSLIKHNTPHFWLFVRGIYRWAVMSRAFLHHEVIMVRFLSWHRRQRISYHRQLSYLLKKTVVSPVHRQCRFHRLVMSL